MLKKRKNVPLDYSLCNSTVTVYRREGLTRWVLEGVHFEYTSRREVVDGVTKLSRGFLLVIPEDFGVNLGDMVMLGIGPELEDWDNLRLPQFSSLGVVTSVQRRYWRCKFCHTEARG